MVVVVEVAVAAPCRIAACARWMRVRKVPSIRAKSSRGSCSSSGVGWPRTVSDSATTSTLVLSPSYRSMFAVWYCAMEAI